MTKENIQKKKWVIILIATISAFIGAIITLVFAIPQFDDIGQNYSISFVLLFVITTALSFGVLFLSTFICIKLFINAPFSSKSKNTSHEKQNNFLDALTQNGLIQANIIIIGILAVCLIAILFNYDIQKIYIMLGISLLLGLSSLIMYIIGTKAEDKQKFTKSRPFLLAALIMDLVVFIIALVVLVLAAAILYDEYLFNPYGYMAESLLAEVYVYCSLAFFMLIPTILSTILLIRHRRPVSKYPIVLVVLNMVFCAVNVISLAFFIVDLAKHSQTKECIRAGEVWLESDQETEEHFEKNPVSQPKKLTVIEQKHKDVENENKEDAMLERLERLKTMKEQGVISEKEFQELKTQFINNMKNS